MRHSLRLFAFCVAFVIGAPAVAQDDVLFTDEDLSPETVATSITQGGDGALRVETGTRWGAQFGLAEVDLRAQKLEDTVLRYSAQMKAEDGFSGMGFLELWVHFSGEKAGSYFSRAVQTPLMPQHTEWQTFEAYFFLKEGEVPDSVTLNLVVGGIGAVHIRDLKLVHGEE